MPLNFTRWAAVFVLAGLLLSACTRGSNSAAALPSPTTAPTLTPSPPSATRTPLGPPAPASPPPEYLNVAVPTINPDDPLRFTFPTPILYPTPLNWRPPVQAVPLSVRPEDHFWFARPIASDRVNYPLGSYRYGSTYFGGMNIHAGIDIDAPPNTPILAAGPGQVVWAGWGLFYFTPGREDDPYGIAVAIRHDFGYNGQTLYTLYAHMTAENNLFVGQRVNTGDVLGWVGSTGNSSGPHVHFEVRVGKNDYYATRNPELWIAPYSGWGVLAGQALDKNGQRVHEARIDIYNPRGGLVSTVYSYGFRVAVPDEVWRENFATSDLPAGVYTLRASLPPVDGEIEVIEGQVNVVPGQTTFVRLQSGLGFLADAPPGRPLPPAYPSDTPTATPTPTATSTASPTRTPRPSPTATFTRTPRPSPSATATRTPRFSPTPSPSPRPTATPTLQLAP